METSPPDGALPFCPVVAVAAAFMPRLAEFAFEPGLVAAVDQHAAAVRDRLAASNESAAGGAAGSANRSAVFIPAQTAVAHAMDDRILGREDLADYILGFMDALAESSWREQVGYDFATLRLTAICWLIREHDLLAS